jgi:hypothetical protein
LKKVLLAVCATAAASAALISPSPAAATCTEVIDGGGCIENAVCGAVDRVLKESPVGRDSLHCIE